MDLALYYKVHGKRMDQRVILRYVGYVKTYYFPNLVKNHVWRTRPEAKSRRETFIIKIN